MTGCAGVCFGLSDYGAAAKQEAHEHSDCGGNCGQPCCAGEAPVRSAGMPGLPGALRGRNGTIAYSAVSMFDPMPSASTAMETVIRPGAPELSSYGSPVRSAGVARSGLVQPSNVALSAAAWAALSPAEQQAAIDRANGGGAGSTGAADTATVPAALAGIYTQTQWNALPPADRARIISEANQPDRIQQIINAALGAAGIATSTYLTYNREEREAANARATQALQQQQADLLASIRSGGSASTDQLTQLMGLITAQQRVNAPPPADESKGLSTTAMVGIGVAAVVVVGFGVYMATRPRNNPSYHRPHAANRSRRAARRSH